MTELDIDLIDSNEAMLVLNSLPNVQILNGRSTKDEDDEEEEENPDREGEYEENNENEEIENHSNEMHKENRNIYKNEIINMNNHLYPQMEEIQEDKNLENNSNYVSEANINDVNTNKESNTKDFNSYGGEHFENEKSNWTNKEKENKMTRNNNTLKEKEYNKKIEFNDNMEGQLQPNTLLYDKIISDNSNKKIIDSNKKEQNIYINDDNNNVKEKLQKERESIYDLNNINNNFLIDITNDELNSLKEDKYCQNSDFFSFMEEFCNLLNNHQDNSDGKRLQSNYLEKLNSIEERRGEIPNYYYFFLLYKKKIKILQNMYYEIIPYIINKCPELNENNILNRLNTELFTTIKDSKELINILHSHIESYSEKKENKNDENYQINDINEKNLNDIKNLEEIIKEKDRKIASLEQQRDKLLKNMEEDKLAYSKKISNLEKENKAMTEKILTKANSILNSSITETQNTISMTERPITKSNINSSRIKSFNNMNNKNKKCSFNNELLNTNFINYYNPTSSNRSPIKLTENTNTIENNNTINYYLNTHGNSNTSRNQLISLKTLKDFINELYLSKSQYDVKCQQFKLPKETLEEHMYTFLNKKYGLKNLIIEWAKNVILGIKYYSKKDSIVLLFGKIMRNEQEEDARFIIQKVSESIEELLLYYIKRQNPLKLVNEINKIFERKKKTELFEEEWKGIIYSIYEKEEAGEIEKKIVNFINKENEKKKMEMFKKYKNSRMKKQNKNKYNSNTNYINNNTYYLNTINSFNNPTISYINNTNSSYRNSIGNININNKLSRVEKYNMLLFPEDKKILFTDFIKIVLDNHIRFRDKQLKNFLELFHSVDTNRDGVINEEEFTELIQRMKIFKEDEVENKIFQFLEKLDPFDNQKFTFSECVSFFSSELIKENDINGNEKEISILEKVCFKDNKNGNSNIETINNDEKMILSNDINSNNNNINNIDNNHNDK